MSIDLLPFMQKKAALGTSLAGKLSANTYSQFLAQQRGNRQMADVTKQFKMQTPKVMNAFLRRGMAGPGVQSGVYERGLQDFAGQQLTARNDVQQALNDALDQLKSQRAGIESQYKMDLADLEMERANAQAQAAATLAAFKPYLGG
jgi:hypothetical protein